MVSKSENPPKYEDVKPASTTSQPPTSSETGWSNIQNVLDSSGISDAARRISGAGDYFRHTILANVERLAGDAAIADEKERLALKGYQQMIRGRSREHTHTPPVTEYHAPEAHHNAQAPMSYIGSTAPPGYVEPAKPVAGTDLKA